MNVIYKRKIDECKSKNENLHIPYTYLIGWSKLNKWYYGSKYAKGCHPKDFWKKYFTSSKHVDSFRKEYGEPDVLEIRKTFENVDSTRLWEKRVLINMRVMSNESFLNRGVGCLPSLVGSDNGFYGKKHSEETKAKISKANSGKKHSIEAKEKMSKFRKGKKRPAHVIKTLIEYHIGRPKSEETKAKISKANSGKKHSEETKAKISKATTGKNNPMFNKDRKGIGNRKIVINNISFDSHSAAAKYFDVSNSTITKWKKSGKVIFDSL